MNKEFIPYEQILELKALGFDGILWQEAFRWFREKHRYYHILNYNAKFNVWVLTIADFNSNQLSIEKHNTYEEAELACLKKLIEIVDRKAEAYN
jgi:hypothetical protein